MFDLLYFGITYKIWMLLIHFFAVTIFENLHGKIKIIDKALNEYLVKVKFVMILKSKK